MAPFPPALPNRCRTGCTAGPMPFLGGESKPQRPDRHSDDTLKAHAVTTIASAQHFRGNANRHSAPIRRRLSDAETVSAIPVPQGGHCSPSRRASPQSKSVPHPLEAFGSGRGLLFLGARSFKRHSERAQAAGIEQTRPAVTCEQNHATHPIRVRDGAREGTAWIAPGNTAPRASSRVRRFPMPPALQPNCNPHRLSSSPVDTG